MRHLSLCGPVTCSSMQDGVLDQCDGRKPQGIEFSFVDVLTHRVLYKQLLTEKVISLCVTAFFFFCCSFRHSLVSLKTE